jgi:hypothetical protein
MRSSRDICPTKDGSGSYVGYAPALRRGKVKTLGRARHCESSLSAASTFHRAREAMLCERTQPPCPLLWALFTNLGVKVFSEVRVATVRPPCASRTQVSRRGVLSRLPLASS